MAKRCFSCTKYACRGVREAVPHLAARRVVHARPREEQDENEDIVYRPGMENWPRLSHLSVHNKIKQLEKRKRWSFDFFLSKNEHTHKKNEIFILFRCRLCQLNVAVELAVASSDMAQRAVPSVAKTSARFPCFRHGRARFGSISVYALVGTPITTRCRSGIFRMCLTTPHSSTKEWQGWRGGGQKRRSKRSTKKAKKCSRIAAQ